MLLEESRTIVTFLAWRNLYLLNGPITAYQRYSLFHLWPHFIALVFHASIFLTGNSCISSAVQDTINDVKGQNIPWELFSLYLLNSLVPKCQ